MKLGAYELVAELGRGGMGVVWKARAPSGALCALKLLRTSSQEARDRFERERRLLATLGAAEGFVPLLDAGSTPQGPFVVMPLLEGGTLRARLEDGPLGIAESIELVRTLARALGEAHARGIVHRDLKPENVLFDRDGRPFVADLGLAKHFRHDVPGASQTIALSRTGDSKGTTGYAAPEQIGDARSAGPPADVFALGAILQECVTGEPPFTGGSAVEVVAKVLAGSRDSLAELRPEAPAWLEAVVARALAVDPAARHADGAALARALDPDAGRAPARSSRGRGALVGFVLGACALVAAGVAIAIASGGASRADPAPDPAAPTGTSGAGDPAKAPPKGRKANLPALCRGFVEGRKLALERTWGGWRWQVGTRVLALAWARDGKTFVTGGWDNDATVWDPTTGDERVRLRGHRFSVNAVGWLPDGSLVTTSDDGTLGVWDVATGKRTRTIAAHEKAVQTLAVSPDGKLVATGGEDSKTKLWELATGRVVSTFEHPAGTWTHALAFAPDGESWLAAATDGTLVLRDRAGEPVRAFPSSGRQLRACAFFPDGKRIVAGGTDRALTVWTLEDGSPRVLEGHTETVHVVAVTPDGKRIVSGAHDRTVRVWDAATGRCTRIIEHHDAGVTALAPSPDGKTVLTGSLDGRIGHFDLATGRDVRAGTDRVEGWPVSIATSADEKLVALGNPGGGIRRIDLARGVELAPTWTGRAASYPAFAPDGKGALVAAADGKVTLWDAALEKREHVLFEGLAAHASLYLDARRAATAHADGLLRIWDLGRRAEERIHPGHNKEKEHGVLALALAGEALATGCRCGAVRFLEERGRGEPRSLSPRVPGYASALARVGETRLLEAGGNEVRVIELADGRSTWSVDGGVPVLHAAASADGRLVAVGFLDATLRLYDATSGTELDRLDLRETATDKAQRLAFVEGGRALLVGTARGALLRFRVR